jgi:hypothetical protein
MTYEEIAKFCKDEGIQIMGDALHIILDRDEVSLEQMSKFLSDDDNHPQALYENFVVRGINDLSDYIQAGVELDEAT